MYANESNDFRFTAVNKKFHSHTAADYRSYVSEILDSHFILAPRGLSPSSYRLFEAMQYARCPVIISDDWQAIDGIDWNCCSIRFAQNEAESIYEVLKGRVSEAEQLGQQARIIWEANFADGIRENRMLSDLIALHEHCSWPRDIQSMRALWRSRKFYKAHGWALEQRVSRRVMLFMANRSTK
jgi:hypothetical protein